MFAKYLPKLASFVGKRRSGQIPARFLRLNGGESLGRNLWGTAMLDLPMNRILIAVAVFIGLAAVLRHVMTRRPVIEADPEGERGQVAPNRALLAVICLIGVALAGAALSAALRGVGGLPVLAVGLAAQIVTGMMVTAFFPFYDITWDADGIEGPTLLLPPPIGPRRRKIFWEDIEVARQDKCRHWFLEDGKGNRIVWSFIYDGHPALMRRIEEECPWLFTATADEALADHDPGAIPPVKRRFLKLNFATAKSS
jgi:hypothetical protein